MTTFKVRCLEAATVKKMCFFTLFFFFSAPTLLS